jgi:glutathione S-transferase
MAYTLIVGNRNYSSWSLRGWLALKRTGEPFEEVVIPLDRLETREQILRYSPSGRLPVLVSDGLAIWDSLAIGEYLAETFPQAQLWPADAAARALARSVAAEMHSGFSALRQALPMNIRRKPRPWPLGEAVHSDITRIAALWRDCRKRYGEPSSAGPYLFGAYTLADVFYTPVASRFQVYAVEMDETCAAYAAALLDWPDMKVWSTQSHEEPWIIDEYEK